MLRRLGSLGGGGTAHRELSGHDACSKLVSSLRCDFDLQSLHGNLPNKTLVKSLCPELCCVPLNISQPIGTAVCPWNVARPRGIANTCNTSHLTRSWIKTCLVDHMTTVRGAIDQYLPNYLCLPSRVKANYSFSRHGFYLCATVCLCRIGVVRAHEQREELDLWQREHVWWSHHCGWPIFSVQP